MLPYATRERRSSAGRPARGRTCFGCPARERAEWRELGDEELRVLNRAKTCNEYPRKATVFFAGNPCQGLHCVAEGTLAIRRQAPAGFAMPVRLAGPGDVVGYRSFFGGGGYLGTAQTLEESTVCFIPGAAVTTLVASYPALAMRFLGRMARDLACAEGDRLLAATVPLRGRLAHALLQLRERFGSVQDDGTLVLSLPFSRGDLAGMLGARPESLARLIRTFGEEGIATFERNVVRIHDLDDLMDVVGESE